LRAGLAARDAHDEKMDQVRELLFGDDRRRTEARLVALEVTMRDLERSLLQRLDAIQARIEALAGEVDADRRTSFEVLAEGIDKLADDIRRIGR
jgi:hypothetical protein